MSAFDRFRPGECCVVARQRSRERDKEECDYVA